MKPAEVKRLGYQPVLDGIRGVAVLSVLAFNLEWRWLPGGFLGVDIFFALSGFLITTLLLEEWQITGSISLKRFAQRRALRLMPALAAVVLFVCVFTVLFHDPAKARGNLMLAVATLLYLTNWATIFGLATGGVLGHAWSLAVEVHFYVLWALLLVFLLRTVRLPWGVLGWVALAVALSSWAWRAWLWQQDTPWLRLYLGTDTRLDGVFIGAAAAVLRLWWPVRQKCLHHWIVSNGMVMAGMITAGTALVAMLFLMPVQSAFTYLGGFSAAALATVILILLGLTRPAQPVTRLLCCPPLVWFGTISYSLYLWHLPLGALLGVKRLTALGVPAFPAQCLRAAACIAVASLCYYFLERRFFEVKARFRRQNTKLLLTS